MSCLHLINDVGKLCTYWTVVFHCDHLSVQE